MKRIFLSVVMAFIAIAVIAQQVPRDKVVIEIGTATW